MSASGWDLTPEPGGLFERLLVLTACLLAATSTSTALALVLA